MATLKFPMKKVNLLVKELASAKEVIITRDMLFNPNMHKGGVLRNIDGLTPLECEQKGISFYPSEDSVDRERISKVCQIVVNHGTFLSNNAKRDGAGKRSYSIPYAEGFDPGENPYFLDDQVAIFGPMDDVFDIPFEWALKCFHAQKEYLIVEITPAENGFMLEHKFA